MKVHVHSEENMRAKEFDQGDRKQIQQILLWNHFIKGSPKNMLSSVFTEVTEFTLGGRNDLPLYINDIYGSERGENG